MNFVTGGTGLVGSHILLELAKENAPITAMKRPNSNLSMVKSLFERNDILGKFESIKWVNGSLSEVNQLIELMKGCTTLYHCAALVSFDSNDRQELIKTNIDGTSNIVDAALEVKPKKVVYLSSTAAIGKQPKSKVITENLDWEADNKNGAYSFSKHYAEREVWRGIEEGLSCVILNPSVILGPGDWGSSSTRMFSTVYNGLQFYTKGANAFVDVRDVAQIALKLANSTIENSRFLILSENLSFKEVMGQIAIEFGKKPPSFLATPFMGYLAGLFSEVWAVIGGTKPLITRDSSKSANTIQVYSNEKIKSSINHEFIPIHTSLRDTCRIFIKQHQ